jgi:hypothetical protein
MIETKEIPIVKASDIKAMFDKGMTRPEIAKAIGISTARLGKLINGTPSLKDLRPAKHPVAFVDDLAPVQEVKTEPVNANTNAMAEEQTSIQD